MRRTLFDPEVLNPQKTKQKIIDADVAHDTSDGYSEFGVEESSEVNVLRSRIREANVAYHSGKGRVKYTDDEYDAMLERLGRLAPSDPLLSEIGAPPSRGTKVRLPISMPSLPKVRVGEPPFSRWLNENPPPYTISDKLDGVSGELVNLNKGLKLYTRGDGTTGTDISHLLPVLRGIGPLKKGQIVRGEIIITTKAFGSGLSKDFANQRNLVSAIVNKTKIIHPDAHRATFVVHEMLKPRRALAKSAASLKALGFVVVPHRVVRVASAKALESYLEKRRAGAKSDIDGLVLESSNGERVALKSTNEVATAKVKEVTWAVSRHGRLKPVIHFVTPVVLAGAKVSRATAHNAKFIKDGRIGKGALVTVVRSGEVIPKITAVVKPAQRASLPPEGTYVWDKNGTEIMSTSEEHADEQRVQVLVNFLRSLGIKSFKGGTMSSLVNGGIDTVEGLMIASVRMLAVAGLKGKRGSDLFAELKDALDRVDHPTMMAASGKWPPGFGLRRMRMIEDAIGKGLFVQPLPNSKLMAKLLGTPGIGQSVASEFVKGLSGYRKFLRDTGWRPKVTRRTVKQTHLTGKKFIFTGFRDQELQDKLEAMGAKISGSVGPTTDYVVTPTPKGSTVKLQKARKFGVDIITPDKALSLLG